MLLKNNASCLYTINHKGERYKLLPGDNPAVEVPDEVSEIPSVAAWIDCGDLVEVAAPKKKPGPKPKAKFEETKDEE